MKIYLKYLNKLLKRKLLKFDERNYIQQQLVEKGENTKLVFDHSLIQFTNNRPKLSVKYEEYLFRIYCWFCSLLLFAIYLR